MITEVKNIAQIVSTEKVDFLTGHGECYLIRSLIAFGETTDLLGYKKAIARTDFCDYTTVSRPKYDNEGNPVMENQTEIPDENGEEGDTILVGGNVVMEDVQVLEILGLKKMHVPNVYTLAEIDAMASAVEPLYPPEAETRSQKERFELGYYLLQDTINEGYMDTIDSQWEIR